ncbi:28376_t:CDS:2, partial [Gigaspora margarita]
LQNGLIQHYAITRRNQPIEANQQSVSNHSERNIELEAENAELRKENTEIPNFRRKISEFDGERAELMCGIAETLKMIKEERARRAIENAKLKARIQ